MQPPLLTYVLRQADRSLVLAQRLLENVTLAPELEEDVAQANVALDLIGQARVLYGYAGQVEGLGHDEDHFAYWRDGTEFLNPLLVEIPNGDFAHLTVRQFLYDAFAYLYWQAMTESTDRTLSGLASKATKETAYHLRHSQNWVLRLGDGTTKSRQRCQSALDSLWRYTCELFEVDEVELALITAGVATDPSALIPQWEETVRSVLSEATLSVPGDSPMSTGGRYGSHTEALSYLLGEMQVVARAHPGAKW